MYPLLLYIKTYTYTLKQIWKVTFQKILDLYTGAIFFGKQLSKKYWPLLLGLSGKSKVTFQKILTP